MQPDVLTFRLQKVQHVADLSEKDLRCIAKLDRLGYDRRPAVDLLAEVLAYRVSVWRLGDEGIVLLSFCDDCLWVEGVAGDGLLVKAEGYKKELERLADGLPIRFAVSDPQLLRFYKRIGFKPVATIMEA